MARNLRARLVVAIGLTAFVSVAVTAVVAFSLVRGVAERSARADLARVARQVMASSGAADLSEQVLRLAAVKRILQIGGDELAVVRRSGIVAGITDNGDAIGAAVPHAEIGDGVEGSVSIAAGDFVYVVLPSPSGRPGVAALILARRVELGGITGSILTRMLVASVIAVAVAFAVAALVARRLARPVDHLTAAAERIARGDLSQRVPVETADEIGRLASSFNLMTTTLDEARRREREFLANVSHELRTPITAIRGYAEAMQDGALGDDAGRARAAGIIQAEATRLERMVEDVMALARLGAGTFTLDVGPVDVSSALHDIVNAARASANDAGVDLEADLSEGVRVETDAVRVQQIVTNLVHNALRVTPSGGRVTVRARASGGGASIEVADTGPGIAPEDLPHVFERTYLWKASREKQAVGTGLGLAIVRELVTALDGRVTVESSAAGTAFRVELAAAPRVRR